MAKKGFLMGILGIMLVFGMAVVGCDDGSTGENGGGSGNNDPKTLVITNIDGTLVTQGQLGIQIGIFPVGTTPSQALAQTGIIAGTTNSVRLSSSEPFHITAPLYSLPYSASLWTGSGTYDIYLTLGGSNYYRKQNVTFTSASTSADAGSFSPIGL
jgi:hypothetical protein